MKHCCQRDVHHEWRRGGSVVSIRDVQYLPHAQLTRERVSCERFLTLQRLKMNQKRQA
jgi:hypothetical protein